MQDLLAKISSSWALPLLIAGAVVDVIQFLWIIKRTVLRLRRKVYHRIERQLVAEGRLKHREEG